LLTLPVIDDQAHLIGVITPDDVIAMLRAKM
jgi:Mg/Co/Ni transporter MgtE